MRTFISRLRIQIARSEGILSVHFANFFFILRKDNSRQDNKTGKKKNGGMHKCATRIEF